MYSCQYIFIVCMCISKITYVLYTNAIVKVLINNIDSNRCTVCANVYTFGQLLYGFSLIPLHLVQCVAPCSKTSNMFDIAHLHETFRIKIKLNYSR